MITKYTYRTQNFYGLLKAFQSCPEVFVPTGSRTYGGATNTSDYDFVVDPRCAWHRGGWVQGLFQASGTFLERTEPFNQTDSDRAYDPELPDAPAMMEKDLVYIAGPSKDALINLVFCDSQEEFEAWVKATELLKSTKGTLKRLIETDKQCRIAAFKTAMLAFWKGGAK